MVPRKPQKEKVILSYNKCPPLFIEEVPVRVEEFPLLSSYALSNIT